jgi:hypothetical protein
MRHWFKLLSIGFSLAVTLGVSFTAQAYPPQCADLCTCNTACGTVCFNGVTEATTCGADSYCVDNCRSARPASVLLDGQEPQEDSPDICTAQLPASRPAGVATDPEVCYEVYDTCMQQASGEPVDWIRSYSEQRCELSLNDCLYWGG